MPLFAPAVLSRRRFVAVSAGVTGLVVAGGCALPVGGRGPDPLLELLTAAERDARELAAADASHGDRVGALRRVADARRVHADRLAALVERPDDRDQSTDAAAPAPAPSCPPVAEVRDRLRSDARRAAEVAADADEARAELAASVSAACSAAVEVVLA